MGSKFYLLLSILCAGALLPSTRFTFAVQEASVFLSIRVSIDSCEPSRSRLRRSAIFGRSDGAALRAAFGGGQRFALLWGAFGAPWALPRQGRRIFDSTGQYWLILRYTCIWAILGHIGLYWSISGHIGAYRAILGYSGQGAYWSILGHVGSHWAILGHIGSYWVILVHIG